MKKTSPTAKLVNAPYIVWSILFILAPMIMVVYYALTDRDGNFTLSNLTSLFDYTETFGRSIWYAFLATVICLLLSYPLAYIMARSKASKQRTLMMLGQQMPNLRSMVDEYVGLEKVKDLNGNEIDIEPANVALFIDTVDGYDELTADDYDIASEELDRVTGKIRTHGRTYKSDWHDEWASTITLSGFWTKNAQTGQPQCTAAELIERWIPTFDQFLNEYNSYFG